MEEEKIPCNIRQSNRQNDGETILLAIHTCIPHKI